MKKLLFVILVTTFVQDLNAQVQKGTILTGGSLNFYVNSTSSEDAAGGMVGPNGDFIDLNRETDTKRSAVAIAPQIGIFVSGSVVLGGGLIYEYSSHIWNSTSEFSPRSINEKSNMVYIAPYLAKYASLTDELYFTTTFNLQAGLGKKKRELGQQESEEWNTLEIGVNVTPGITYFFSDKLAVTGSIGRLFLDYSLEKQVLDADLQEVPNTINASYGLSLKANTFTVGLQYFLRN